MIISFNFHYPERGRKLFFACRHSNFFRFNFHYPERGRKPTEESGTVFDAAFNFHYPERGRKQCSYQNHQAQLPCSISITPKGDGNGLFAFIAAHSLVQFPLPRKGTETLPSTDVKDPTIIKRSISITPKGDGNPAKN